MKKTYEAPELFELADALEATKGHPVQNPYDTCGACLEDDPCGSGPSDGFIFA